MAVQLGILKNYNKDLNWSYKTHAIRGMQILVLFLCVADLIDFCYPQP